MVRLSVYNFVMVGLLAVLFILLLKAATTKWSVPGVSKLAAAV